MDASHAAKILAKRRQHLLDRIEANPGRTLSYDEAEAGALRVALQALGVSDEPVHENARVQPRKPTRARLWPSGD